MWLIASKLIKLSSLEMRNIIRSGSQTETIKFHLYIFGRNLQSWLSFQSWIQRD